MVFTESDKINAGLISGIMVVDLLKATLAHCKTLSLVDIFHHYWWIL